MYIFTKESEPLAVGKYDRGPGPHGNESDSAVLWSDLPAAAGATKIGGLFAVSAVMPKSDVQRLKPGTPVCLFAGWAYLRCEPLRSATDTIKYRHTTGKGDSGAPVFIVDRHDRATLIGIHRGKDGQTGLGEATYAEPALSRLGVEPVFEP